MITYAQRGEPQLPLSIRPHPVFHRVAREARAGLIRAGERVLVAVSGGPDSVALLTVLAELRDSGRVPGLALHAAHVNYGLRGAESEEDEAFVRELTANLQVPLTSEHVRLVRRPGCSLQQTAREARYAVFERLCHEQGLTAVTTGHTADDQAETILLWLLRGAGSNGLTGIPAMRPLGQARLLRPLLHVMRSEVLEYLACRGVAYRNDTSNATVRYRRNRIRHEVLPLLRSLNPRVVEGLGRVAELLAADASIVEDVEREAWQRLLLDASPEHCVLDGAQLALQPLGLQRRLVRRALAWLQGEGARPSWPLVHDALQFFLKGQAEKTHRLPHGLLVRRAGRQVIFTQEEPR